MPMRVWRLIDGGAKTRCCFEIDIQMIIKTEMAKQTKEVRKDRKVSVDVEH